MDKQKLRDLKEFSCGNHSETDCITHRHFRELIDALLEEPNPFATEIGIVETKEKCREIKKLVLEILNYV